MTELEENKDESKEKEHFLNKDETLVEIPHDGNSLFRCLAHHNMKEEITLDHVKSIVAK
jgi:hypothetical protein